MAITLVATPGSASANSYATVAEADAYVETYLLSEASRSTWLDLDVDDRARLLIQATRQLDWYFTWNGSIASENQSLGWPRYGVWENSYKQYASTVIPGSIKDATVEMALWLSSTSDDIPQTGNYQFDEIAVGPIRVNFNEKAGGSSKVYMPDKVVAMLQSLGIASNPDVPTSGQVKVARLVRG